MRRLTTPTHIFEFKNFDVTLIKRIKITYTQGGKVILEKRDDEISVNGNKAVIKLTQEETAMFETDIRVKIQVRVLTTGGDAFASDITMVTPQEVLDDEVLR